jgi:hypothetical protein
MFWVLRTSTTGGGKVESRNVEESFCQGSWLYLASTRYAVEKRDASETLSSFFSGEAVR